MVYSHCKNWRVSSVLCPCTCTWQ